MRSILTLTGILLAAFFASGQTLSPCAPLQAQHIVVLGSSTAAGAGASSPDSAWVGRYRNYLQSLNANNQVTNLAVGGYNTYRLMPTGYVPPSSRPDPDTARNITAAIQRLPDVIIVNLPSNDVALGYSVSEQLANFDTLVAHAQNAGIPIWVSTTQPRNFSAGQVAMQQEVRDSIWAKYSPHVLDFWTPVADTNGWILPSYNSGDGVHLNDAGHRLLFEEVVQAALPDTLFVAVPYPNIAVQSATDPSAPCGADSAVINVFVVNAGLNLSTQWIGNLGLMPPFGPARLYTDSAAGLAPCVTDTLQFVVNTATPGTYTFNYFHSVAGDQQPADDTMSWTTTYLGLPSLQTEPDTICSGGWAELSATPFLADTVAWYEGPEDTLPIGWGRNFLFGPVPNRDTLYAQSIRGPLHYSNSIFTTDQSNINWNGTMFDLVAHADLTIDSFSLKVADPGLRVVSIYAKPGSHLGFETTPGAWTFLGHDTLLVSDPATFVTAVLPNPYQIQNGDTVGIYLEMQAPSVRLSYRSVPNPVERSNDEITILTGSGSNHNFGGGLYFPRDWNGTVHYHHGFNPMGICRSDRIPVPIEVDVPKPDLGPDTTITLNDSIQLSAGPNFTGHQWSTGAVTPSISISGSDLGVGTHQIMLIAKNQFGCAVFDLILITVEPVIGTDGSTSDIMRIYPNPSSGIIHLRSTLFSGDASIQVLDTQGRSVAFQTIQSTSLGRTIELTRAAPGLYWIRLKTDNLEYSNPIMVVD